MNINELTLGQIRELQNLFHKDKEGTDHPYVLQENYFIRTVTHHYTGKLVRVTHQELVLIDAAWIADDGRFSDALKSGTFNEVEPYTDGEVIIGRGAILDAFHWKHKLPREQK